MTTQQEHINRILTACDRIKSGEFSQCRGELKINNCYCILGCFTQIFLDKHPDDVGVHFGWNKYGDFWWIDPETQVKSISRYELPLPVAEWYGFDIGLVIVNIDHPNIPGETIELSVMDMNDAQTDYHRSLEQLASLIEQVYRPMLT